MMKVWCVTALLAVGNTGGILTGQTRVDLGAQSRNVDFSEASSVRPFPTGAVLPAACSVGQMYFLTGSTVNIEECIVPNVWVPVQTNPVLNVQWRSGTVLTIGPLCALSTPCVVRIGSIVHSKTAPAAITLTGGSGLTYIYIDNNGNIIAGVSSSTVTCAGCQVVQGTTQYPLGIIPLGTWNATDGVWDQTGTNDLAPVAIEAGLNAGSNITITQSGPNITIAGTGGSGSGGSGGAGTGSRGVSGTSFNPTDPTQWYRDHITLATGFQKGLDGWDYTGSCVGGTGSGATGFSSESMLPTTWLSVTGASSSCFYSFPTAVNGAYGGASYDYWSGPTPASLWASATYMSTDTNGTHYVGLMSGGDFIGCRQAGSGDWFAVIHAGGNDVATADTGVAHDGNTHRLTVDNASGTFNTVRCSVDGGTAATASGTVPAESSGWNYIFGAVSGGAATNFAPFQYTIFLQGLPRL